MIESPKSRPLGHLPENGRWTTIGRRPGSHGIVVKDPTNMVSRRHLQARRTAEGRILVRDISRHGTWLKGRRLKPNEQTVVGPNDVIRLAKAGPSLTVDTKFAVVVGRVPSRRARSVDSDARAAHKVLVGSPQYFTDGSCGEPQKAWCQLPRGRQGSRGSVVDDVSRRGALRGGGAFPDNRCVHAGRRTGRGPHGARRHCPHHQRPSSGEARARVL